MKANNTISIREVLCIVNTSKHMCDKNKKASTQTLKILLSLGFTYISLYD